MSQKMILLRRTTDHSTKKLERKKEGGKWHLFLNNLPSCEGV
jgi:hypothetical protein